MKQILAAILCSVALNASAQSALGTLEEMRKCTAMADATLEYILQKGEDPAVVRRIAKFKKNLFDALLNEGFTKEQALSIVDSTPMPSVAASMK